MSNNYIKRGQPKQSNGWGWFLPALQLILIAFKLAGVITWPWVWVMTPLWLPVAALVLVIVAVGVLTLIAGKR